MTQEQITAIKKRRQMKNFINNVVALILMLGIPYLILALINWEWSLGAWNGFWRFIFAIYSIIILIFAINNWNEKEPKENEHK